MHTLNNLNNTGSTLVSLAEYILGNIKMQMHFLYFLNTDGIYIYENVLPERQGYLSCILNSLRLSDT